MSDYSKDYRTLSCWECFQAKGKMCHDKNYDSMIVETGSSNFGHGICCKPGFNDGFCATEGNDKHICSEPAVDESADSLFKNIRTGSDESSTPKFNH